MAQGREILGYENRQKALHLRIPIGGTGAIGAWTGKGVTSVTRTSAGKITVVLDKRYPRLLGHTSGVGFPGATTPTDGLISVDNTNVTAAAASLVIWTALVAAPTTAADLASGSVVSLQLFVSDSDV